MSLFIAGCDGSYSIIIADTKSSYINGYIDDLQRKLYYHGDGIPWVASCGTTVGYEMYLKLKESQVDDIGDIIKLFKDSYDFELNNGGYSTKELNKSAILVSWITIDSDKPIVRLGYVDNNIDGIMKIENKTITIYPKDVKNTNGDYYECEDIYFDADFRNVLIKYVEKFIAIKEESNYVSSTCCIGFANAFETYYFEDDMYKMLQLLQQGETIENKMEQIIKFQQDYDSGKILNDFLDL